MSSLFDLFKKLEDNLKSDLSTFVINQLIEIK